MAMRARTSLRCLALCAAPRLCRSMVSLHGRTNLSPGFRMRETAGIRNVASDERPPNPLELLTDSEQDEQIYRLTDWFHGKRQVLCLTGAGLSTESGIPDYRGSEGSYHKGHKPIVHDQFMKSEYQRKRYWGRGLVGWKSFNELSPNEGHYALAKLEARGHLGVDMEDREEFYEPDDLEWNFSSGHRRLSLVTQNVDSLHRRAGSKHFTELHGRGDRCRCMECGRFRDRKSFHSELANLNHEWLQEVLKSSTSDDMRADGDAAVNTETYDVIKVPPCAHCGGFMKPDVVFFGDSVPKNRVAQVREAVDQADGILVVGSSLAVHSAFRHVRAACQQGIPVAVLNVGQTRAEVEGLDVTKVEAPAGPTLAGLVEELGGDRASATTSV